MTHGGRSGARDPQQFAAADTAATQHTLNYALGNLGGRQKAWMSAGQAAPPTITMSPTLIASMGGPPLDMRGRGRPPKARPDQQRVEQSHPRSEQIDSHPPSNSTSPQLANVLSHPTFPRRTDSHPLPSPPPSEEVEYAFTRLVGPRLSMDGTQDASSTNNGSAPTRVATPHGQPVGSVRQASKRPAEGELAGSDARSRGAHLAHQARTVPPPLSTDNLRRASFQQLRQGQSASPVTIPSPFSPDPGSARPQGQSPYQSPLAQNAALQGTYHYHQMPVPAGRATPQGQASMGPAHPPPAQQAHPPQQIRADAPREWYTQQDCQSRLDQFLDKNTITDQYPCDRRRLRLLKDAITLQDWAFLTMHQYYCLLSADHRAVPASLLVNPSLPAAILLMRYCLEANDRVSPPVLQFFAKFPLPLSQLGQSFPERFERQAQMFSTFMHLSSNYNASKAICEQRNYPQLMRELVYELGISSPIFQRVVFTANIRNIWALWGGSIPTLRHEFETQANSLFSSMQESFYHRDARRPSNPNEAPEFEQQEREVEMQLWGSQLKRLCDEYRFAALQQVSNQPTQATATQSQQQSRPLVLNQPVQATATQSQRQTHPPQPQDPQVSVLWSPAQAIPAAVPRPAEATVPMGRGRGRGRGRPRLYPGPSRPQLVASDSQVARQQPQPLQDSRLPARGQLQPQQPQLWQDSLLPARGQRQPLQREPAPGRFALHQAHLRSPVLRARSTESRLYQYVDGFLRAPARVSDASCKVEQWTFTLTREEFELVPKNVPQPEGAPPVRDVDERSRLLRLRCVKWTSGVPNEHTWATADTSWIRNSYFTLNGKSLQPRKKLHHGKDLPMDLSPFVKEGENLLEIAVMRQRDDETYRKYLVAIEVIRFRSYSSILTDSRGANYMDHATSLARIKQKLAPFDNDDEISFVENNLSINIFDPFTNSHICSTPARGRACLHYDVFDVVTFLETREKKGDASAADQWKCPLCNGDARPQHLVMDGFLDKVCKTLQSQNLLDTRAIVVDQDGSWKPKVEVRDPHGVQDRDISDDEAAPARPRQPSRQAEVIEVIDLSD